MNKVLFATLAFGAAVAFAGPASAEKLKAVLDGKSEVPATTTSGTGTADLDYDAATKKLSWKVSYSGLSGPATAAHFHGPAEVGKNAGVAVPIPGPTVYDTNSTTGDRPFLPFGAASIAAPAGATDTIVSLSSSLNVPVTRIGSIDAGIGVRLVDADPQGNATSGAGVQRGSFRRGLYHSLVLDEPVSSITLPTVVSSLEVVPSNKDLAGAEIELVEV